MSCLDCAVVTDVGDGEQVVVETGVEHEGEKRRIATTASAERLLWTSQHNIHCQSTSASSPYGSGIINTAAISK